MIGEHDFRKKVEFFLVITLVLVALIYGGFRIYPLIMGPRITIYNPQDGDIVASSTFELSGQVLRAKEITLQGRLIPISTDGHFTEILVASPPYTILILRATDYYGKSITKTIRVIPQ